jgi:hypothetical protein
MMTCHVEFSGVLTLVLSETSPRVRHVMSRQLVQKASPVCSTRFLAWRFWFPPYVENGI